MTNINVDETTRNAILAALDERAARLEAEVARRQAAVDWRKWFLLPPSEDAQRALVWNIAALHETNMARLLIAEAGESVQTLAEAVPWEPARPLSETEQPLPFYGRDGEARGGERHGCGVMVSYGGAMGHVCPDAVDQAKRFADWSEAEKAYGR